VVLKTQWNLNSDRIGLVVDRKGDGTDHILVLWTDKDGKGVKLKYHVADAVLAVNDDTIGKVKKRVCDIK